MSDFSVVGNNFHKKNFSNTFLATNTELYKFFAKLFFENDLGRVVWASADKMFKRRQEQLLRRKNSTGTLDVPFLAFRTAAGGSENETDRRWFNQSLNVDGIHIPELGKKVKLTPITLKYEAVYVCQHDTDLQFAQNELIWTQSNETLIKPILNAWPKATPDTPIELTNIGVVNLNPQSGSRFQESDWATQNKIQAIDIDVTVGTYLIRDNESKYSLSSKVVLEFLGELYPGFKVEGEYDEVLEEIVFSDHPLN